ncbi:M20/M25/M40 family metallo-hydrolase [Spirosoma telluris]|uniref:M20/M25/M40 family metallo-hydrolase n=1 Tax=Spirosoma telluris TaxID=2183553 RepID=UPI0018DB84EA
MTINAARLQHFFEVSSELGKIGETGMCRPAHSALEKQMFAHAKGWMEAAGLTVRIDSFGNLIGRLKGKNPDAPILMTGSHLDTQPYGGRFDGIAGVLCAIEAVCTIAEKGIVPETSIDVIAFADEESWRFNKGLFGSRVFWGNWKRVNSSGKIKTELPGSRRFLTSVVTSPNLKRMSMPRKDSVFFRVAHRTGAGIG